MLKENTVDKCDLIEKAEHITFNATEKTFFDYYINRYEVEVF